MLAISGKPLDLGEIVIIDHLNALPDGTVTASLPNGEVLSVQPDGRLETRPPGTDGPWERAAVQGDKLVFNPGVIYVFAFLTKVPNV
jgi:hypothetical protein